MAILANAPADFVCSYNGFTFSSDYTDTKRITIRPVQDKTGRTVMYNEYTIALTTWITSTSTTDPAVLTAKRQLTKFGGAFKYTGRGVGDLSINAGGTSASPRDVEFGPKPTVLGIEFHGRKNACKLDWEVTFKLPECSDAKFAFALMEMNYAVEFHVHPNGRTDRVVRGELRIPNNRAAPGSRKLLDNPDTYREKIITPIPKLFRREYQPFVINEAKTTLTFGWTDFEISQEVLPEGIVKAEFSQTTNSEGNSGFAKFITSFQGRYTLAQGFDVSYAKQAFHDALKARIGTPVLTKDRQAQADTTFVPMGFGFSQPDAYADENIAIFTTTVLMLNKTRLRDVFEKSGAWYPITDPKKKEENWDKWEKSLRDNALSPRGTAKLKFTTNEDRIIDLCGSEPSQPAEKKKDAEEQTLRGSFVGEFEGWLKYNNAIRVESDSGNAELRQLPQDDLGETTLTASPGASGGTLVGGPGFEFELRASPGASSAPMGNLGPAYPVPGPPGMNAPPSRTPSAILPYLPAGSPQDDDGFFVLTGSEPPLVADDPTPVQKRTRAACYVYMTGEAVRIGQPIPCPTLLKVEDIEPTEANRLDKGEGFVTAQTGTVGMSGDVPVYVAKWNLRYFLPETPNKPIAPPPNPLGG